MNQETSEEAFRHTPTVLELADRSHVKPEGMLEDIVITIASLRYPDDFLILQPKSNLGGVIEIFGHCNPKHKCP